MTKFHTISFEKRTLLGGWVEEGGGEGELVPVVLADPVQLLLVGQDLLLDGSSPGQQLVPSLHLVRLQIPQGEHHLLHVGLHHLLHGGGALLPLWSWGSSWGREQLLLLHPLHGLHWIRILGSLRGGGDGGDLPLCLPGHLGSWSAG